MGRYKGFIKEPKAFLKDEYGALSGTVNENMRRKASLGEDRIIARRPTELLKPEIKNDGAIWRHL